MILVPILPSTGKLDKGAVLKAICSGYKETTDPPVCLSDQVETNECLINNGGCWMSGNITACKVCSANLFVLVGYSPLPEMLRAQKKGAFSLVGSLLCLFVHSIPCYVLSFQLEGLNV